MLPITTLLASFLGLFFFWLSIKVIERRRALKILIGTGDQEAMEWAIRAHANFAEYVPISLILFACAEFNNTNHWILATFALMLLAGRAFHAYGFLYARDQLDLRVKGMLLTFWTIGGLSIWNIGHLISSVSMHEKGIFS